MAKKTPKAKAAATATVAAPVVGGTEEVVVRGRPLATAEPQKFTPMVVDPDNPLLEKSKDYRRVAVKALRLGIYGHKRRPAGEVFVIHLHKGAKELPTWMEYLEDVDKGQDEGSRGLQSGGREDDRIREERKERADTKALKKSIGKGAENIDDPTIINDSLPLTEGGNARKPEPGGERSVI